MSIYRKYRVPFYGYQLQTDLNDLGAYTKSNSGYRYILTVIDMFSRYTWAVPLKTKKGDEITLAFKKHVFSEVKPVYIQADMGTEFYNRSFKKDWYKVIYCTFSSKSCNG
jgi:hypothetical protein